MEWRSTQEVDSAESTRQAEWERFYFIFFVVFCEVFQSLHWSLLLEQSEDTIITTILLQWLCSACLSLERAISCAQLSCQIAVFGPVCCGVIRVCVVWTWMSRLQQMSMFFRLEIVCRWPLNSIRRERALIDRRVDVVAQAIERRFHNHSKLIWPFQHPIASCRSIHSTNSPKKNLSSSTHCVPEIYNNSTLEISLVIFWTSALCSRRSSSSSHHRADSIHRAIELSVRIDKKCPEWSAKKNTTHCTWRHLKAMVCFFDSIY